MSRVPVTPSAPRTDGKLSKAELARRIAREIRARGLTQKAAAGITGISQPRISKLLRGQIRRLFSLETLVRALGALGHEVRIVVGSRRNDVESGTLARQIIAICAGGDGRSFCPHCSAAVDAAHDAINSHRRRT